MGDYRQQLDRIKRQIKKNNSGSEEDAIGRTGLKWMSQVGKILENDLERSPCTTDLLFNNMEFGNDHGADNEWYYGYFGSYLADNEYYYGELLWDEYCVDKIQQQQEDVWLASLDNEANSS